MNISNVHDALVNSSPYRSWAKNNAPSTLLIASALYEPEPPLNPLLNMLDGGTVEEILTVSPFALKVINGSSAAATPVQLPCSVPWPVEVAESATPFVPEK